MPKQLKTRDLIAWAAGFIDGEGSVVISTRHPTPAERAKEHGSNQRHHAGQLMLSLAVWQTKKEPLLRLLMLFGGRIYVSKARSDHHAEAWQWRLLNQVALDALLAMEPFLVNKAPHVRVARDFRALVTGTTWGPPGMPDEEIEKRVVLREAMRLLNQKGPRDA